MINGMAGCNFQYGKVISTIVVCLLINCGFSQILNNRRGEVWTDNPFFNRQYIKDNNIRSIKGRYCYKDPGKPMRETNFMHVFDFDSLGRIVQKYETRLDDGSPDTVFQKYAYNVEGSLVYYSQGTSFNYNYTLYFYDKFNSLESTESYIQLVYKNGEVKTVLDKKESYEYNIDGIDTIKITKNSYDLAFKKEWKTYNRQGYVTSIDERFISNGQGKSEYFEFGESGNMEKKTFQNTRDSYPKTTYLFTYDSLGNVQEKKIDKMPTFSFYQSFR